MQQRIPRDLVDDRAVVYRGRSTRRSYLPLLGLALVVAVVASAGLLGPHARGSVGPTSRLVAAPSSAASQIATVEPTPVRTPEPTESPRPIGSPAPSVLEYIALRRPVPQKLIPPGIAAAAIGPARLRGATLPAAQADSGFAASGTKVAFVGYGAVRVIDLERPEFAWSIASLGSCSWVPEMTAAAGRLAYLVLRPLESWEDGCGDQILRFDWQVWLTDFDGTDPQLVAEGDGARGEPSAPISDPQRPPRDEALWRPHLGLSADWLAWSVPNPVGTEPGPQPIRAVPIADPSTIPIELPSGGRVAQLAVGGSTIVAAVRPTREGPASGSPYRLEVGDAAQPEPLRDQAAVDGPIAVSADGLLVAWRSAAARDARPGFFVHDAEGNALWERVAAKPTESDPTLSSFVAVDGSNVSPVAVTTIDLAGEAPVLFLTSYRWPAGAAIVDAPSPLWGHLEGANLIWVGLDSSSNELAAMTLDLATLSGAR